MGKYVFVYYDQGSTGDTPMEDTTAAWGAWFGQLGDKLIDAGNPFNQGGKAVEKSGVTTIENFPATGYSIVKAETIDEAVELAKGCPLLVSDQAAVRIYEALPM